MRKVVLILSTGPSIEIYGWADTHTHTHIQTHAHSLTLGRVSL